ncbi:MAG TPA: DUF6206 family protein [Anaerolineales bacterium]
MVHYPSRLSILAHQNPVGYGIQSDLLLEFERGLDPLHPERSRVPCQILGYGEISTVFEIDVEGLEDLAFKRMCIFETLEEAQAYASIYTEYSRGLERDVGLHLPPYGYALMVCDSGRPIFYIIQKRLPPESVGNKALHRCSPQEIIILFRLILRELHKVWRYNQANHGFELGIDGQISNWAIEGFAPNHCSLDDAVVLLYLDTSTPLYRRHGVEQLNPELFLRSAPPYLVWILRLFFVKDVMTRYYDPRKVIIDLIANFYKEQRPELVSDLVAEANEFINGEAANLRISEITVKEVRHYYREDEIIWSLYLSMRRFDRFVRGRVLHRNYPYILPGKIQR